MPFRDLTVNRKRICRRAEAPCDIVRERTGFGRITHMDRNRCRNRGNVIAGAHLIAGRQIPVHSLPAAKLQRDLLRAVCQRLRRGGHHIGHIAGRAVRKRRRHDHAGFVKGLTDCVLRLFGHRCDLNLFNASAEGHQKSRIILEVNRAVTVGDWAADCILCLAFDWRKQSICCPVRLIIKSFRCQIICFVLTLFIAQDTELTRRIVVKEININVSGPLLIGCRQHTARLRIALCRHTIRNFPVFQVDDRDVVAGICRKLAYAADTNIGAAIVDDRRGGAHGSFIFDSIL